MTIKTSVRVSKMQCCFRERQTRREGKQVEKEIKQGKPWTGIKWGLSRTDRF